MRDQIHETPDMIINPYRFGADSGNPGTSNLVGWWDLEESTGTRSDAHTNGLDLSMVGAVGSVTGKVGDAANISTASSNSLRRSDEALTSITGALTITGWIKADILDVILTTVLSKSNGTGDQRSYLLYRSVDKLRILVNSNGTSAGNTIVESTTTISTGVWYFVAGVFNPSVNVDLWVNGTKEASAGSAPSALFDSSAPLEMFTLNDGTGGDLASLDSVNLWDAALTDEQIGWIYNSGSGRAYADL